LTPNSADFIAKHLKNNSTPEFVAKKFYDILPYISEKEKNVKKCVKNDRRPRSSYVFIKFLFPEKCEKM
jgi:hypothetical protein